jgi:hypothetical protein
LAGIVGVNLIIKLRVKFFPVWTQIKFIYNSLPAYFAPVALPPTVPVMFVCAVALILLLIVRFAFSTILLNASIKTLPPIKRTAVPPHIQSRIGIHVNTGVILLSNIL